MPEAKLDISIADWKEDETALGHIRRKVFIEEQNVPAEMEWDQIDASATHFIVTLQHGSTGTVIGTARLAKDGKIGRMAILPEHRNRGTGSKLLEFVLKHASGSALQNLYLHAQVSAIAFYEKHGFHCTGDKFSEAGIPHRLMMKYRNKDGNFFD